MSAVVHWEGVGCERQLKATTVPIHAVRLHGIVMGVNGRGCFGMLREPLRRRDETADPAGVWDETGETRPATDGPWRVR